MFRSRKNAGKLDCGVMSGPSMADLISRSCAFFIIIYVDVFFTNVR